MTPPSRILPSPLLWWYNSSRRIFHHVKGKKIGTNPQLTGLYVSLHTELKLPPTPTPPLSPPTPTPTPAPLFHDALVTTLTAPGISGGLEKQEVWCSFYNLTGQNGFPT